jgi:hypothetical protein
MACAISETNESEESNQEKLPTSDSIQETRDIDMTNRSTMIDVNITIGDQVFSAKLYDNKTIQAFIEKLPLDINMSDVNSNEKFYSFTDTLPTDSERPGEIHAGDIMLYGDNGLVLFYETFSSIIARLVSDILRRQNTLLELSETGILMSLLIWLKIGSK